MMLQYDDIVSQVVARLLKMIPQGPPKVAVIAPMKNPQKDIEDFLNSSEQTKIMVTYSGNNAEGYKHVDAYILTMNENTQYLAHTIEVHLCSKLYMVVDGNNQPVPNPANTMLKLMYMVPAALRGLKMYRRDPITGAVLYDMMQVASAGGMFLIESFVDKNFPGVVCVCRFQIMEVVTQADDLDPEQVFGNYREITFEEFSQVEGQIPDIGSQQLNVDNSPLFNAGNGNYLPSGTPENSEVTVNLDT